MGDDFQGSDHVDIEPGSSNVPLTFRFRPSTGSTANTGAIPYGSTLQNSTFSAHRHDDTSVSVSTSLIPTRTLSSNSAIAYLCYSTAIADGRYDIVCRATVNLAGTTINMVRQYDFDRVYVKNR